jgi:hypothetical protein
MKVAIVISGLPRKVEDTVKLGRIYFQEKNFTRMIDRKGLYDLVVKHPDLKFDLLRENKLWY